MTTGQIISGVGHLGLIVVLLFGGQFRAEPLPFQVTDVDVVSNDEFEAMLAGQSAPDTVTEVAMPKPPEPDAEQSKPPKPSAPDVSQKPPDTPSEITPPAPDSAPDEQAALVPEQSARPEARPVDRIAPKPVEKPPEPDAEPDPVRREETSDAPAETVVPEDKPTAPPEAVTEITPEASNEKTSAPKISKRPMQRPKAVETAATKPAQSGEKQDVARESAVNSALAEALDGGGNPQGAGSDPLTQGETDGLIAAIKECWSVDPYAASGKVTVIVGVKLNRDGTLAATPKFISASGGEGAAVDVAFRNARTAVIACGRRGFNLPAEKYEDWRDIEVTFNPKKMRLR
ncbi:energy transducer TonB [Aquicoccus sp. G2-2]|uniref:energy transducer TonB n=1 Tax=Aquicoccus sp. G2-2 TaxID=3092120 RepID=UPI00366BEFB6